jgi:hypothetical protein
MFQNGIPGRPISWEALDKIVLEETKNLFARFSVAVDVLEAEEQGGDVVAGSQVDLDIGNDGVAQGRLHFLGASHVALLNLVKFWIL